MNPLEDIDALLFVALMVWSVALGVFGYQLHKVDQSLKRERQAWRNWHRLQAIEARARDRWRN